MKRILSFALVAVPLATVAGLGCSSDGPPPTFGQGGSGTGGNTTGTGGGDNGGSPGSGGMGAGGDVAGTGGSAAGTGGAGAGTGGAGAGTGGAGGSSADASGQGGASPDASTGAGGSAGGTPDSGGGLITGLAGIPNQFSETFMNSFMLFPCLSQAAQDCITLTGTCPNQGNTAIPMEQRGLVVHEYFQLGGTVGTNYRVTLSVSGVTEGKYYTGGTRFAGTAQIANVSDPNGLNTFYTGGAPVDQEFYNIYKIIVRNPPSTGDGGIGSGTEVQHYYLNSFPQIAGQNLYEAHNSFPIHFVTDGQAGNPPPIVVPGGGVIEYLLSDSNCHAIDNCGPGSLTTTCTGAAAAPRRIPTEPNLALPATWMGRQMSGLNIVNGANQPFHAQILHLAVTNVVAM